MSNGNVVVTLSDGQGGVVVAPLGQVQAVIGWCSGLSGVSGQPVATQYQIVATQNPNTLISAVGYGPGPEAAALTCAAGGTVLFMPVQFTTKGAASAVVPNAGNTGTSVMTVTQDATNGAWDDWNVKVLCTTAGTIGTGPVGIQVSVDAGRNYGPAIALGTATTYAIANTGLTLNFSSLAMGLGDSYTFHTTGPKIADATIQTALTTLAASQYGVIGWGSTHIVGNSTAAAVLTGGFIGSDVTTIQGYLTTLFNAATPTRVILACRDASPPAAYGGTGESDATWYGSVTADVGTTTAARIMACAGYYNTPSAYPFNTSYGSPSPRRSSAWSLAARTAQVGATPQRMQSRVRDGSIGTIVVNPASDPLDGFVYHDDGSNGPFDTARICALRTRKGKGGLYVSHPNLLSLLGSAYNWWPKGAVIDVAVFLANQLASNFIDDDLRVNANGTLYVNDINNIQNTIGKGMDAVMLARGMVSGPTLVVVSQTANVSATSQVPATITVYGRGYVDEFDITIGFNNALAA